MQTVTTVGLLMVVAGSAFAQAGDGLEYQSQNSAVTNLHSSIVTEGNGMYRDTRFAREFDNNVLCRQAIFLFGQCYGGGMLDEINTRAANWAIPVAGISAARHDQLSWARSEDTTSGFDPFLNNANTPAPLRARRTESTYALRWFPPATNAPKTTVRVASVIARNNDVRGPVAPAAEFRLTTARCCGADRLGWIAGACCRRTACTRRRWTSRRTGTRWSGRTIHWWRRGIRRMRFW